MLQLVLDTIPVRVFWKNRDSVYLGCNQLFARDAGLPNSQALVGKRDAELVWSAQAAQYRRDDQCFMERGEAQLRYEEPQTTPAGHVITLLTSKVPLRDPQGNIIGILGVYDDITETRKAEELLRLREAALRAAANVVVITGRNGLIVWTNPAFTRETGYAAEEVVGRNPRILKGRDYPPTFYQELWKTITRGEVWHGEFHNRCKDGSLLVEDSTITPLVDEAGKITHFIAVKQNITQRKRTEEALRASEEEFRTMFEMASTGLAQANPRTGQLLRVNQKLSAMTGYSIDELLRLRFSEITHPDDRQQNWEAFQQVVRGEAADYRLEKRYVRKDGATIWVNVNLTVLRDAVGQPTHSLAVIEEISERRESERRIAEALTYSRLLLESSPIGIGTYRATGETVSVNQALARITGATHEQLIRQNFRQLEPWKRSGFLAAAETALATGQAQALEVNYVSSFGRRAWLSVRFVPFEHEGESYLLALFTDISETRKAMEALRESEERLRYISDNLPGCMLYQLEVQPNGRRRFRYISEAVWQLHGCLPEAARQDAACIYDRVLAEDQVRLQREEAQAAATLSVFTTELRIQSDQGMRWSRLVSRPRRLADGSLLWDGLEIDVTERKQAEEALRQRVNLQDQLIHTAATVPGMIYSFKMRPDGFCSMPYASSALVNIFGLRPMDVQQDATPLFNLIHPNDVGRVKESIAESARTLEPWRADFRVQRTRLSEIWAEGHSVPQREPDGSTLWQGYIQDITQRKLSEEKLHESQRLLQSTLDALSAHIAILDEAGVIIAVNAVWRSFAEANSFMGRMSGVGLNYLEVCESATGDCAEEAVVVARGIRAVMANQQSEFHLEYPCHSPNEQRWFEVRATRFAGDSPLRIVIAHERITERKKSETKLRESEGLLQSALDAIPMHIAILDATGMIVAVNAMWKNFAKANNSKSDTFCLGSNYLRICECAVGDCSVEAEAVVKGIRSVMANQQSEFRLEYPCHSPSEQRWFLMRVTRFGDEGPVRLVVAHENITERVRAEEERKSIEVQLRHAQKLESIGQLAAGIAHEINTPTQYIGDNTKFVRDSFAQLLPALATLRELLAAVRKNEVTPGLLKSTEALLKAADLDYLSTELPRAIDDSLQGVERVAKIVRAMKDFSHPGTAEKVQVDLNRAIESTLTVARNEWKYVAEMVTDFDPNLPPVRCLPGEFNQVILNLVVNAAHAIGDTLRGGDQSKGTITVTTKRDGDWVEVRVRDTGTGIPEHARGRIFDPFFTTKAVGKGTGQGLAIAHSVIVDKHGGEISFETEMGKGTAFVIRLPLVPAAKVKPGES